MNRVEILENLHLSLTFRVQKGQFDPKAPYVLHADNVLVRVDLALEWKPV